MQKHGIYYITINQRSKRNFPRNTTYKYSNARLFIAKYVGSADNTGYVYIGAK